MSAQLLKPINAYGYGEFSIDNAATDLDLLPKTSTPGKQNLATISKVCAGSCAYTNDGNMEIYILNGETDTWTLS